jgi:hypothetical protein
MTQWVTRPAMTSFPLPVLSYKYDEKAEEEAVAGRLL